MNSAKNIIQYLISSEKRITKKYVQFLFAIPSTYTLPAYTVPFKGVVFSEACPVFGRSILICIQKTQYKQFAPQS